MLHIPSPQSRYNKLSSHGSVKYLLFHFLESSMQTHSFMAFSKHFWKVPGQAENPWEFFSEFIFCNLLWAGITVHWATSEAAFSGKKGTPLLCLYSYILLFLTMFICTHTSHINNTSDLSNKATLDEVTWRWMKELCVILVSTRKREEILMLLWVAPILTGAMMLVGLGLTKLVFCFYVLHGHNTSICTIHCYWLFKLCKLCLHICI